MLNNIIYKPFNTLECKLPTSTIQLANVTVVNDIPNPLESLDYIKDMMTLFQLMLTPKQTNLVLSDIIKVGEDKDVVEEMTRFFEEDRIRYLDIKSSLFFKNYTIQGAYAHEEFVNDKSLHVSANKITANRFYCYNTELITNNLFEFVLEFTRPQSVYTALMLKLPTIATGAMTEFVYVISTLFKTLKVIKHKNSVWFTDSFLLFASDPLPSNISNLKNVLGIQVSNPSDLKKRSTTFRQDKLTGERFTNLLKDPVPSDFLERWNEFRTKVSNEIFRYHKIVKMSVDSNNLLNDYHMFLKKLSANNTTDVEAVIAGQGSNRQGYKKPILLFDEYMKLIHEDNTPIIPVVYSPSQLDTEAAYNPMWHDKYDSFRARGQVKLYLAEFKYLLRIQEYLTSPKRKLIIYIGAGPGNHILNLIKKFHNETISWLLYDKVKFSNKLTDPANQAKYNITIVHDFFTHETVRELNASTSIYRDYEKHVISDIRLNSTGGEPTTEDLVRDYAIENDLILATTPVTAFLKWRYPFLLKDEQMTLKRVHGSVSEEWLQMYAKPTSNELRLFLQGPEYYIKEFNTEEILRVERLMAAYRQLHRYSPRDIRPDQMVVTSCRCNDCCMFNMLVIEGKKKNITLTPAEVTEACGA